MNTSCCLPVIFALASMTAPTLAADPPEILHLGLVAPHIVGIQIQAGHAEYGEQIPYETRPGDQVDRTGHNRWVFRDGAYLGSLVGRDEKLIYTPDRVVGEVLDRAWADRPGSYRIESGEDPRYAQARQPAAVYRKSKPSDFARSGPWNFEAPVEHMVYLVLPEPLEAGGHYRVTFEGGPFAAQPLVVDPARLRSEAVHVSQLGFRPDDPAKVAFLSCWLGSGGSLDYREGLRFEVVDQQSGRVAFTGTTRLSKSKDDRSEDAYQHNFNGTDVYQMDFSALREPGVYCVAVEGIGCSYPFPIGEDVWREAFVVSARGFYHQRSGVELGPPYTGFRRPRPFHPDDGVKVYASTTALMDSGNGLNSEDDNFGQLVRGKTDEIVPDAWGAYMDAGDWDRRIQHLVVSRYLLELAELFPDYFAEVALNIPESGDGLPDVVSEALFNLDAYRRMQTAEGGIRGGIESEEHPRHGEGSWQESLTIMAYAPGVWSSYEYAGVAARAAHWLEARDPERAEIYRDSALRAMEWAEKELPKREGRNDPHAVHDSRNLAAAELFRLTGDPRWHGLFLQTTFFKDLNAPLYQWQSHEQRDAAWVYLRTDRPGMDEQVKANALNATRREADERAAHCEKTAFRWTMDPWRPAGVGALSAPDGVTLIRAHALTGEEKYLRAAVLACQTGAGANPVNLCYTTGLGQRSPRHPLHIDSRITHQPPPPGLTVFGPADVERDLQPWAQELVNRFCFPPVREWPTMEAYWDVFWYPVLCEFTVQSPMAQNAYVWGYLAARR